MSPTVKGDRAGGFTLGHAIFDENWVTAPATTDDQDGLGPRFNQRSCSACHSKDGRAPPFDRTGAQLGMLFRLSIPGADPHNGPLGDPNYGGHLRTSAILGSPADGVPHVAYTEGPRAYGDGTAYSLQKPAYTIDGWNDGNPSAGLMISARVGPFTIGLGLLEAIPESAILANVKSGDPDNVVGRPNHVWDPESNSTVLGRFGWKANVATVRQQTAGAFQGDMGITSSLNPSETCTPTMTACLAAQSGGAPEIDDSKLDAVVFYMRTLAVPARRSLDDEAAQHGAQLFDQFHCSSCHVATFQTGTDTDVPEVAGWTIHPYTDLLLHDMGTDLADNRADYEASGSEWRTPPLWGIGLLQTVNGHTPSLARRPRSRLCRGDSLARRRGNGCSRTFPQRRRRRSRRARHLPRVTLSHAPRRLSLLALTALALVVPAFFACDDNTGTPPTDYTALIKDLTENVVLPEQTSLRPTVMPSRRRRLSSRRRRINRRSTSSKPPGAPLALRFGCWMRFTSAPIADDEIVERIDVAPADPALIEGAVTDTKPVNVPSALGGKSKGFLGLQYLIFGGDALSKLQSDASGRRKQLVTGMAAEIASSGHQIVDDWTPGKGGYQTQVETAGAGSTRYPSQRAVVDDYVGGVGYALEVIVGIRLAEPLGSQERRYARPDARCHCAERQRCCGLERLAPRHPRGLQLQLGIQRRDSSQERRARYDDDEPVLGLRHEDQRHSGALRDHAHRQIPPSSRPLLRPATAPRRPGIPRRPLPSGRP